VKVVGRLALVAVVALGGCAKSDPSATPGALAAPGFPLRVVKDLPLPGGTTRLDYQDVDPTARRLYVAHLGDSSIHIVDLDTLKVLTTIDGVADVHGVRLDPDDHRLYASATGTNQVVGIDTNTDRIVSRASTGRYPDGIAYDPRDRKLYVSNEHDTAETVIDARTGHRTGTVTLGGEAGNSVYDPSSGMVLVNVQDKGHIAVIDPATGTVTSTVATPGCDSNHGLYLDTQNRSAFVACEGNAKLLVIDLDAKTVRMTIDIGTDPDVLPFDPGLHRLYVASESGTVTIINTASSLGRVAQAKIAETAHTVAVDPTTHRVYLPLEDVDGRPVLRVLEPTS
jgi:DNA-binding beta-propeller fold protein YncE